MYSTGFSFVPQIRVHLGRSSGIAERSAATAAPGGSFRPYLDQTREAPPRGCSKLPWTDGGFYR